MTVKEEGEKVDLKLNIQKTKIMASSPITSWQTFGETVSDFIFLGSKVTADGDCSHEIKRCLLLGRKVMTNLDSIFKSRDITLPTKVHLVKAMVFPVVMYGCECWAVKKSWVLKNWCIWTVVLEKTLESPLDCKEIQPVHSEEDQPWDFFGRNDAKAETPVLWSSAYLRILTFLPAILIPASASSSPVFLMMYSAYRLNKQGDNIQPWRTPFPTWNQSVPCPVPTVASWPAYRFLKRQVRWSGTLISFRIFHSLLWSTQSKALA